MKNKNTLRGVLIIIITLLTSACLSPQAISIHPKLNDSEIKLQRIGEDALIRLRSKDARAQKIFGTRGGIYGKTAEIRPSNDIAEAINNEAKRLLIELGFAPHLATKPAGEKDKSLQFIVEEFSYTPSTSWITKVKIKCVLKVIANNHGKSLNNTYDWETEIKLPFSPTAEHNETYMNEALNATMKLAFSDLKLLTFIAK